jgi:predicted GH43/DUF377 family glycosyl hydrolase
VIGLRGLRVGSSPPALDTTAQRRYRASGYTAFSSGGPDVAVALTRDFKVFERLGLVMQPDDKDAALLPRRINGSFALG